MKRKLFYMVTGFALALSLVFCPPKTEVKATEVTQQAEYPVANHLDLFELDWETETEEKINHYLGMSEWYEIGVWLASFSEQDLEKLLQRNTLLIQETEIEEPGKEETIHKLYYEYALEVYEEQKDEVRAGYPAKTSGYWQTRIVKTNYAGAPIQTSVITFKISGIDTSKQTTERQSATISKSIDANYFDVQWSDQSGTIKTYKEYESNATYPLVRGFFNFQKPAGYHVSVSYNLNTSFHKLYWNSSTFNAESLFGSNGVIAADRKTYPDSVTYNGISTASYLTGEYSGRHHLVAIVNMYVNAGIGTTVLATNGNLVQTIVLSPTLYNVNYNGNGATAGAVSAQSCAYDTPYATQPNGYARAYTVAYNGNGGTPAQTSQTATYGFAGWGLNQASVVNYAPGQAFSNLTPVHGGSATMYAIWSPGRVTLPSASRTGYRFAGWNIGAAGTTYVPVSNITAVANWTANTYKITFNSNGGSTCNALTATYDKNISLPTPKRAGYTFTGWNGQGGTYKGLVKNLTATNGATVALTAGWSANTDTPYTIRRWKQPDVSVEEIEEYKLFSEEEGDLIAGTEILRGTTDSTVTVPAERVDGYETPEAQMIKISGDGSSVIDFYYKLIPPVKNVAYYVEHYVRTKPDGTYALFARTSHYAKEDSVVTPEISREAIAAVNAVEGCSCVHPSSQTITVTDGMIIKYYYDCVSSGDEVVSGGQSNSTTGQIDTPKEETEISKESIEEIVKQLAAGLSFSLEVDGAEYEIVQNEDGTLAVRFVSSDKEKVVIPDVVQIEGKVYRITEIQAKAFKDNHAIREVHLSVNISRIGESAFEGCSALEKAVLHEGLVSIESRAFFGCTSLKELTTPSSLQNIGNSAFQNCTSLSKVTLNEGLLKIGTKAFYNCKSLKKIKIPKTVLKIQGYAFGKCKALKKVSFAQGSQLLSMGTGVFSGCTRLTGVVLPNKLTNLPAKAFENCKALKKIVIGTSVSKVGAKACYKCKKLKTVKIHSKVLNSVGNKAFKKCRKGIRFEVPAGKSVSYQKLLKGKY